MNNTQYHRLFSFIRLIGCTATRHSADGLELVIRKWRHSLIEIDLSWTSVSEALDQAVMALAEDSDSPLK